MADEATRPAVDERGEITLTLDGQSFALRPSFEAISAFEVATGKGLMDLTRAALEGRMTTFEVASIATECIRAWGRSTGNVAAKGVNPQRIAELIHEADGGFRSALTIIAGVLALASTGGCTASGEVKAATKMTTTDEAPAAA